MNYSAENDTLRYSMKNDTQNYSSENNTLDLINILTGHVLNVQPVLFNYTEDFVLPADDTTLKPPEPEPHKPKCYIEGKLIDNVAFYRWMLIPAFFCIFCLALSKKRTHWFKKWFKGRPGIIYPVNLMQGEENLLPIVAGFVFLGWVMIEFIVDPDCGSPFYATEIWHVLDAFYGLASFLIYACIFYPVFAALTANSLVGYIIGTLYCWTLAFIMMVDIVQRISHAKVYWEIHAMQIASKLPPAFCIIYLCVVFPYRLISRVFYDQLKSFKSSKQTDITYASHIIYVKHLLQRHRKLVVKESFKTKLLTFSWLYKPVPGFKFSKSIIAAVAMGMCFMYMFAVAVLKKFYQYLEFRNRFLRTPEAVEHISGQMPVQYLAKRYNSTPQEMAPRVLIEEQFWFDVFQGCLYTAIIISFVCIIYALLSTMRSYRNHMMQIYSGTQDDIPRFSKLSPDDIISDGVEFVGFQVAYSTGAFVVQMASIFLTLFIPFTAVIAVTRYHLWFAVKFVLMKTGSIIAVYLILKLTQSGMVRYCFMTKDQNGKPILAVDNRRLFFNFHYFAIFGNIALGVVSAVLRIILGALFGIITIPRLDRSTIGRHFEHWDPGHASYIGMLYLEHVYRNPIMLTFVGLLCQSKLLTTKVEVQNANFMAFITGKKHRPTSYNETPAFRRAKIRWQVAFTLINNEVLVLDRKKAIKDKIRRVLMQTLEPEMERTTIGKKIKLQIGLAYENCRSRFAPDHV